MIGEVGPDFLVMGSYAREIVVSGKGFSVRKWDRARVKRFQPDLVFDFAFLTKDSIQILGEQEFARQNRRMSERLLSLAELGTVRNLLTVSSGAAIMRTVDSAGCGQDLYGEQKLANEKALRDIALSGTTKVTIARAWSVTGGHVQKPQNYAFSDFILSAVENRKIIIRAPHPVMRRYCSVEDFLAVALAYGHDKQIAEFDSGGPLVEVGELARHIAENLGNPEIEILFSGRLESNPDNYQSGGRGWETITSELGFTPLTLSQQIVNVRDSLN